MNSLVRTMTENLTVTMKCFARARPEGTAQERDGLAFVEAGPGLGLFNAALLTEFVNNEQELSAKTAEATAYFQDREMSWCFWICEGLLCNTARRRLRNILRPHGLSAMATTPGLSALHLRAPARRLPDVTIRPVSDLASRQSFCHIMTLAFDGPPHQIAAVYGSARFWGDEFRGFLGSIDGQDVCAGATVVAAGAIGIYAVATLPELTRMGYAEALIRQAISRILAQYGPLPMVLQSTPAALNLYRRLGFEPVTNFSVFTA